MGVCRTHRADHARLNPWEDTDMTEIVKYAGAAAAGAAAALFGKKLFPKEGKKNKPSK